MKDKRRLKESCSVIRALTGHLLHVGWNPRPGKKNPIFVIMDIIGIISTIWMRNTE